MSFFCAIIWSVIETDWENARVVEHDSWTTITRTCELSHTFFRWQAVDSIGEMRSIWLHFVFRAYFQHIFRKWTGTKNKPKSTHSLVEAVNVFTSYHMTFLSLILLLQANEKKRRVFGNVQKLAIKVAANRFSNKMKLIFFGVFCCRCIASHFRYRGICQWESSNCLNGFQMNHTNKNQSFEGRLSMFPTEMNFFAQNSKFLLSKLEQREMILRIISFELGKNGDNSIGFTWQISKTVTRLW